MEPSRYYTSVLESIGKLQMVEEINQKDKMYLDGFAGYLDDNGMVISKFGKVKEEVMAFLDQQRLVNSLEIIEMQNKLEKLKALNTKLSAMKQVMAKLKEHPDRYGLASMMDQSQKLIKACEETMNLNEIPVYLDKVVSVTGKLVDLLKEFDGDGDTLDQINQAIDADRRLIEKYKACYDELKQYVAEFPHEGKNDLDVVKQRIDMIKQVDKSIVVAGEALDHIKDYGDRYGKKQLFTDYNTLVEDAHEKMRFVDLYKYKIGLDDLPMQVGKVRKSFNQEFEKLVSIQEELKANKPDMWKEDNEQLLAQIDSWLKGDSKKADIDMDELEKQMSDNKANKADFVKSTLENNPWLKNFDYVSRYENLTSVYVSRDDFGEQVRKMRSEHQMSIAKWVVWIAAIITVFVLFRIGGTNNILTAIAIIIVMVAVLYWKYTKHMKSKKK